MAAPLNKQAEVSMELVEDWEDLEFLDFSIPDKVVVTVDEDLSDMSDLIALAQYRKNIADHEDAHYEAHRKEHKPMRKLNKKTWKSINKFKGNVTALDIIKMIYTSGMTNRWTKRYKKNFPTWHAIGKKWQGQLNTFVDDVIRTMKAQKEWAGGYECDFWYDSIIQVVQRILPRILKRQHKHLTVILESMLDDSRRLDWGHEGLHEGLTR